MLLFSILKFILLFYIVRWVFSLLSSPRSTMGQQDTQSQAGARRIFEDSMLKVLAAAMRADGRVTRSELSVVKQVLVSQFGEERAKEDLLRLRDLLKADFDTAHAAKQIGMIVGYSDRLYIAEILCLIAEADGIITESEKQTIVNMAYFMGLSSIDVQRIANRLRVNGGERGNSYGNGGYQKTGGGVNDVAAAYKTLGIGAEATNEELKTAYRNLVKKYHPDRYATQSQEAQAQAAEKFKLVQEAYEKIKAARGL